MDIKPLRLPSEAVKTKLRKLLTDVHTLGEKSDEPLSDKKDGDELLDKIIESKCRVKIYKELCDLGTQIAKLKTEIDGIKAKDKEAKEKHEARLAARVPPVNSVLQTILPGINVHFNFGFGGGEVHGVGMRGGGSSVSGPRKKKSISKAVKRQLWNRYYGTDARKAKCPVCKANEIENDAYEAGHIVPEAHGGKTTIDNLMPICGECNRSMGAQHIDEYAMMYYGRKVT